MTVCALWLFINVPWFGLQIVIVVFTNHTHLFLHVFSTIDFSSAYHCPVLLDMYKKPAKSDCNHLVYVRMD